MPRVELTGCTPEPLLSYLKALGVLRLIAEQRDARIRAHWESTAFILDTSLDASQVIQFFLTEYRPTPLIACWNGGSGFFPKDRKNAIEAIEASPTPRLQLYREVIAQARSVLDRLGVRSKPDSARKPSILLALRASLPDEAVPWLDAAYVITQEAPRYPPLLGTGAIDGRLEFTNNFMQRLCDVLPELGGDPHRSRDWLEDALFGSGGVPLLEASVGQYHPGGVGGPNATQGIEGESLVNPWDYVLGLEGTVLLAGSVSRRYTADVAPGNPRPAFPFTVQVSAVGYPTASPAEYDEGASRAEIWLPDWSRPASYREISHLLSEGRASWGGRQARTGADFARAVVSLGVDRGLCGFRRFGFLQRSGRAYLATPLGYYPVRRRGEATLLADLDSGGWLERLRRTVTRAQAPATLRRALQSTEGAILRYSASASDMSERAKALQDVLIAVWKAEVAIARSRQLRSDAGLSPFPGASREWLTYLDDGTAEFRIASALASIGAGYRAQQPREGLPPLRAHLEPVRLDQYDRFVWDDNSTAVVPQRGSWELRLLEILRRRAIDSASLQLPHPDIDGYARCPVEDIARFLAFGVDDQRLADLLGALSLVRWSAPPGGAHARASGQAAVGAPAPVTPYVPWAFALLKILFLPWPVVKGGSILRPGEAVSRTALDHAVPVRAEPSVLLRLLAQDLPGAVQVASFRLRAAGLSVPRPSGEEVRLPGHVVLRIGAALLIPTLDVPILWQRAGLPFEEHGAGHREVYSR
ncbi:MAG: type I-U CRISPR-associated protein Csx17 [Limnochordaceae bacterium]|nr:type I-U CRISPR-associated protein Csx17 [Limnochordaceae bacterium]